MTFWQASAQSVEWVVRSGAFFFWSFTPVIGERDKEKDKEKERERRWGGYNHLQALLNIFAHSPRHLSFDFWQLIQTEREKSPPCGSPQKYKDMYCHTPHTFFHAQIHSFQRIVLSFLFLSLKHLFSPCFSSSHKYLPSNTHKQQFFTFPVTKSSIWQSDATLMHTGEVKQWPKQRDTEKEGCSY